MNKKIFALYALLLAAPTTHASQLEHNDTALLTNLILGKLLIGTGCILYLSAQPRMTKRQRNDCLAGARLRKIIAKKKKLKALENTKILSCYMALSEHD